MERDPIDELLDEADQIAVNNESVEELLKDVPLETPPSKSTEKAPPRIKRNRPIVLPERGIKNPLYIKDFRDYLVCKQILFNFHRKCGYARDVALSDSESTPWDLTRLLKEIPEERFPGLVLPRGQNAVCGNTFPSHSEIQKRLNADHPILMGLAFDGYCLKGHALLKAIMSNGIGGLSMTKQSIDMSILEFHPDILCPDNISNIHRDSYLISAVEKAYAKFLDEIQDYIAVEKNNTRLKFISRNAAYTTVVLEYHVFIVVKSLAEIVNLNVDVVNFENATQNIIKEETLRFYYEIVYPDGVLGSLEIAPLNVIYTNTETTASMPCASSIITGIIPIDISTVDSLWIEKLRLCLNHKFTLWFPGMDAFKIHNWFVSGGGFTILGLKIDRKVLNKEGKPYFWYDKSSLPVAESDVIGDSLSMTRMNAYAILDKKLVTVGALDFKEFRNNQFLNGTSMVTFFMESILPTLSTISKAHLNRIFNHDGQNPQLCNDVCDAISSNDKVRVGEFVDIAMRNISNALEEEISKLKFGIRWTIKDSRGQKPLNNINVRNLYFEGLWNGTDLTLAWEQKKIIAIAKYKPQENCLVATLPIDIIKLIFRHLDKSILDDIKVEAGDFLNHDDACEKVLKKKNGRMFDAQRITQQMMHLFGQ